MPLRIAWTVLLLSCLRLAAQPAADSIAVSATPDSLPKAPPKPLQIGVSLTGTSYVGDFGGSAFLFSRFYPGVNFSLQLESGKQLKPMFNVGYGKFVGQYDEGKLSGLDTALLPSKFSRNTFFQTTYFGADVRMRYAFKPWGPIEPYASGGLGFFMFTPRDKVGSFLAEKSNSRARGEQYRTLVLQVPIGAGAQVRINQLLSFGIDYTYRYTLSDYVDNIGVLGSRRGNDQLHTIAGTMYISIKEQPARKKEGPTRRYRTKNDTSEYPLAALDTLARSWPISPSELLAPDSPDATAALLDRKPETPLYPEANRIRMGYYPLLDPISPYRVFPGLDTLNGLRYFAIILISNDPREWMGLTIRDDAPTFGGTTAPDTAAPDAPPPPLTTATPPRTEHEALVQATQQAIAQDDVMYYHPKRKDTLEEIAQRFNVSLEVIRIANDLGKNVVKPPLNRYLRLPDVRKYYQPPSVPGQ